MSDDALVERLRCGVATYDDMADAAARMDANDAEIARLRDDLATARRKGLEDAADLCNELTNHKGGICAIAIRVMIDEEEKRAATLSSAKEDNRPSEEIIREDRDAWPDHQANDPIATARREGMEEAAKIAENYGNRNHVSLNIAAAIRAAAKEWKNE